MFKSLRWRLAVMFVLLSALVYITLALLGAWLFYSGLTAALDEELEDLADQILPTIDRSDGTPSLKGWVKKVEPSHLHLMTTVQLYDPNEVLLEQYGPEGLPGLAQGRAERKMVTYSLRGLSVPVVEHGKLVGYLQLQHPTITRDRATRHFGATAFTTLPLLLLGLGLVGYMFSGRAVRPVEEALAVLRRFLQDAGHELSTPISIIQTNAEALEMELEDQQLPTERLHAITSSTERMDKLVRDLTFLARAESPQLVSSTVPVRLDLLVQSEVTDMSALFSEKGVELTMQEPPAVTVRGNPDSLKRLLQNLLSNALRYTDPGGRVQVQLACCDGSATLSVSDTGIGISPADQARIFDRFYRVEESRSRAAGGSGLGLSIVKAVVDSHHGRVEVNSEPGQGTTFIVTLPAQRSS